MFIYKFIHYLWFVTKYSKIYKKMKCPKTHTKQGNLDKQNCF